jgi:hypothetical protein
MSQKRIDEIAARCAAARAGPWRAYIEGREFLGGSSFIKIGEGANRQEDLYLSGDDTAVPVADFDFIACARGDIPFLLEEIDRLKREEKI